MYMVFIRYLICFLYLFGGNLLFHLVIGNFYYFLRPRRLEHLFIYGMYLKFHSGIHGKINKEAKGSMPFFIPKHSPFIRHLCH